MDDVLDRLRTQVERATEPIDPGDVRRAGGRPRSRLLNLAAVAALVALVIGVVAIQSDQREVSTPAAPTLTPAGLELSVERLAVHGTAEGEEVVIEFDGELPDGEATYADDITSLESPGFSYVVQDMSATVWVCADRHFGFGPGAVGEHSIDVLIPSEWFAPDGVQPRDGGLSYRDGADRPGKIVACGPYRGYVQYSMWSAGSVGPEDVSVFVDGDSIRVRIEEPESAGS